MRAYAPSGRDCVYAIDTYDHAVVGNKNAAAAANAVTDLIMVLPMSGIEGLAPRRYRE